MTYSAISGHSDGIEEFATVGADHFGRALDLHVIAQASVIKAG